LFFAGDPVVSVNSANLSAPAEQAGNNTDIQYQQGDYNLPVCQSPM